MEVFKIWNKRVAKLKKIMFKIKEFVMTIKTCKTCKIQIRIILTQLSQLKQKLFHEHYCSEGHQGIENWSVTLIDQVEDLDSLRKKELYWINRLNTWAPNGLNVREVYEAYN